MGTLKELNRPQMGRGFLHDYRDHLGLRRREVINVDTRKEAEEIANKIEIRITEIKLGLRIPPPPKTKWTEFMRRILNYYEKNKAWNTTVRMRHALRNVHKIILKDFLHDITTGDIEDFKTYRLQEVSPSTVSIELRGLKASFNLAIRWNLITANPVNEIKLPKSNDYRIRRLSDGEIKSLLNIVEHDGIKDLIIVYLNTGARRAELLPPNFNWDSIDWNRKTLNIKGKGNKIRWIPMNETVQRVLSHRRNNNYQYPFNYRPDTVTHKIKKALLEAGIKGASVHTLRKTFGSKLLESKAADIYTVSKLLGHSSVIVTERHYIDLIDENFHDAVRSLKIT